MKLVTIVGARPQFIKAAAFSKEFRKENIEILVHTGQHYDQNMSDIFFEELNIPKPDYNLEIGSGNHGMQTGRMLEKIEEILIKEKPDGVLVYGDTNSTLAGALAASKLLIPVFHIEAGLRSYNFDMPEEQNRILTDHISVLLFCPTKTAVKNLKNEGIKAKIINSGDIMYESILKNLKIANKKYNNNRWKQEIRPINQFENELIAKHYYLATIHRPVNTDSDNNLKIIFKAFNKLDMPVIMPIHPRTLNKIKNMNIDLDNILMIDPVGSLLMIYLLKNAHMVVTDSGGLQKEAYFLKTPCTTLRNETEWVETLLDSWNVLSPIEESAIKRISMRELNYGSKKQKKVFGNGKTTSLIIKEMKKYNELKKRV